MVSLKIPKVRGRAKDQAAPEQVEGQEQWTRRQDLITKATRYGLFAAIGAGVISLFLVLTGFTAAPPVVTKAKTGSTVNTAEQAAAEDLAKSFVVAWLTAKLGEERSLAPYIRTDGLRLPAEATFLASDPSISSVEAITPAPASSPAATSSSGAPVTDGRRAYAVIVSAAVRGPGDAPGAATRRYYSVPIVITDTGARAATIPAPVPTPAAGPDVNLGYRYRITNDHPSSVAVQQFLAALTAGNGEISRYITPGTNLRAITPPPYKGVKVLDLVSDRDFSADKGGTAPKDGIKVRVLATAELGLTPTQSTTSQYALTLTSRGGRWEVSALDRTPLLPAADTTTPTESAAPTASSSPTSPTSAATN